MAVKIDIKTNSPSPNRQICLANIDLAKKWLDVQEKVHEGLHYNVSRKNSILIATHPDTGVHIEFTATIISDDEFERIVS